MWEERKNWEVLFGLSTVSCGLLGVFNSYYGYYFHHYQSLPSVSVSEFMRADFPKKDQEYLIKGRVECSNPIDASFKSAQSKGKKFNLITYSRTTKKTMSQFRPRIEVSYRDFLIVQKQNIVEVQVSPKSEFLAKQVLSETDFQQVSVWGLIKWVFVSACNVVLRGAIAYEVVTR